MSKGQLGRGGGGRMPSRIAVEAQRDLAWVDVGSGVRLMRVQPLQVKDTDHCKTGGGVGVRVRGQMYMYVPVPVSNAC